MRRLFRHCDPLQADVSPHKFLLSLWLAEIKLSNYSGKNAERNLIVVISQNRFSDSHLNKRPSAADPDIP
jgi:hypothetical protein